MNYHLNIKPRFGTLVGENKKCWRVALSHQLVLAAALLPFLALVCRGQIGNYETSWVGNTFSGTPDFLHVQLNIDGLFVSSDGHCYTTSSWDEGGRTDSIYQNGNLTTSIHFAGDQNSDQVVTDGTYIYYAGWGGINYRDLSGNSLGNFGGTNIVNGLALANGQIYESETFANLVQIYNTSNQSQVSSFTVTNPARIAVDGNGGIWVAHFLSGDRATGTIDCYNSSGTLLRSITLPNQGDAAALAIDNLGRLMVCDNGPDLNVKIYTNLTAVTPTLAATFGVTGGTLAGPTIGLGGPLRFMAMTGVGSDSSGNIYISQNGSGPGYLPGGDIGNGAVLESYQPSGVRNWILQGLEFVSLADVDPGSDADVYDLGHHFTMNYNNTVAGTEWSYRSCTYNQFKYPNDPRYRHDLTVVNSLSVRRIQGKLFLFMSNQAGAFYTIYRFNPSTDGDVAIPCGGFSYGAFQNKYIDLANSPTNGEWIWYDANANGNPEPNEFTQPANAEHIDNQWWWTDTTGDVWESRGEGPPIGHYVCQGLDTNGIPKYDWKHFTALAAPPGFTDVAKIIYFPTNDTMYLMGNSLSLLACYTNWSAGNRTASWSVTIPNSTSPTTVSPEGLAAAGGYVFVNYYVPHQVLVYNATNGIFAGTIIPGPEVGGQGSVGNVDCPMCINAYQRTNGEYLIFGEEDYQAKVLMYRWNPTSVASSGTNFLEGANVTSPTSMAVGFSPFAIDSASVVPSNFTIRDARGVSLPVTGATLDDSCHQYVVLTVSSSTPFSLTNGASYVVTVNGITTGNGSLTIAPNSTVTNTLGGSVLLRYFNVNNASGTIADLLAEPNFTNNTPAQTYLEQAIEQTDINGPFGEQWLGYFQPPATGYYTFNINSDGDSELFLSLDATITNQQLLCAQYGAGPSRAWINGDYGCCNDNPAAKTSSPTYLVAGNQYFLQCLYEGPGNQDKNCSVTWAFTSADLSYSVTNYNTPRSVGLIPWAPTSGQVWVTPGTTNPAAGTPFQLTGQCLVAPSGPNSYQWYSNGVAIAHATGLSYSVANAEPNYTGSYKLVVTTVSPHLSFTSAPVTVAVNLPQATMTCSYTNANSIGTLALSWGVAGVLQQTPTLSPAAWTTVAGAPSGSTGGAYSIPLTNSQPAMYYRLKQWP